MAFVSSQDRTIPLTRVPVMYVSRPAGVIALSEMQPADVTASAIVPAHIFPFMFVLPRLPAERGQHKPVSKILQWRVDSFHGYLRSPR